MPLPTEYVTKTEDLTWFMFRHNSFYDTHLSRWTMLKMDYATGKFKRRILTPHYVVFTAER